MPQAGAKKDLQLVALSCLIIIVFSPKCDDSGKR